MMVGLALFGMMCLNYGLNTISFRMIAKGSYLGAATTDALIAAFGFWMIQEVAHTQTWGAFVGYVCGGVTGTLIGLWLTKRGEHGSDDRPVTAVSHDPRSRRDSDR